MVKRADDQNIPMPPSATIPWLVILFLAASIVLVYMGFLRGPDKLLGPPLPKNEFIRHMKTPQDAPHAP